MKYIKLEKISKSFDKETCIFDDFSYSFYKTGFYLLYGESGCGKTTLLNIICGLEKPDSGKVTFNGKGDILSNVAYITQDTYYVDYLNVLDNLKIAVVNAGEDQIKELVSKIGIIEKIDEYPDVLSGGEKQRLAIARALLQKKKIIILDEPTAALDKENTKVLLNMLDEIKKDALVIATSHDEEFLSHADYVIDFHRLEEYVSYSETDKMKEITVATEKNKSKEYTLSTDKPEKENKSLFKLIRYMNKERRYKKREKKSYVYLTAFFILAILVSDFFYDIADKFDRALLERYGVNRSLVYVDKESVDELSKIDGVVSVDYVQGKNAPYYIEKDGEYVDSFGWFDSGETLPGDESLFPYADEIEYGTYFTGENQIIVGYDYAESVMGADISEVVGRKVALNPLDGKKEYEIVGVLGELSEDAENYFLQSCVRQPNIMCYFNGEDLKELKYHEWAEMQCAAIDGKSYSGRIAVYVYFKDLVKLKKFYNQDSNQSFYTIAKMESSLVDDVTMYTDLEKYANPVKYVMIAFAVLFFFQTRLMEMNYHSSILAVYNYNGYKKWKIRIAYMTVQMKSIILSILCGCILSVVAAYMLNGIDSILKLCPFILFEIDTYSMLVLSGLMLASAIVMSFITGLSLNVTGWFTLLKRNRDLL